MVSRLLVVSALALAVAASASGAASRPAARGLPARGVLTPGVSLGGVHLGDTMAQVEERWGDDYRVCPKSQCHGNDVVWYFIYGRGEPLGAAVRFLDGKARAVFTLGAPPGWHTAEGLLVGEQIDRVDGLYGKLSWSVCIGYAAMSMHNAKTVTSIYTTGEAVYGFALSAPGMPICE